MDSNIGTMLTKRSKKDIAQRLKNFEDVKHKLTYPMIISQKFDGVFAMAIKREHPLESTPDNDIVIISRTGEEYTAMNHLKPVFYSMLKGLPNVKEIVFEAYIHGVKQSIISGKCRDTKAQHPEITAMIVGIIFPNEEGSPMIQFSSGIMNKMIPEDKPYLMIPHIQVHNEQEVMDHFTDVLQAGGEGVVLCNAMVQPYNYGKRDASMVKLKQDLTVDLKVTGYTEGRGKYQGMIGGLVCEYKRQNVTVSGMTDKQRKDWKKEPSLIVGKIIEVKAMVESSKGLLREPRFISIRHDKEEQDNG